MKRALLIGVGSMLLPACAAIIGLGDEPQTGPDEAGTTAESGTDTGDGVQSDAEPPPVDSGLPRLDPDFNEGGIYTLDRPAVAMTTAGSDVVWIAPDGVSVALFKRVGEGKPTKSTLSLVNGATGEKGVLLATTVDPQGTPFVTVGGTGVLPDGGGATYWARTFEEAGLVPKSSVERVATGISLTINLRGVGYQPSTDETGATLDLMVGGTQANRFLTSASPKFYDRLTSDLAGPLAVTSKPTLRYFVSVMQTSGGVIDVSRVAPPASASTAPTADTGFGINGIARLDVVGLSRGTHFGSLLTETGVLVGGVTLEDKTFLFTVVGNGDITRLPGLPLLGGVSFRAMALQGTKLVMAGCVGSPSHAWMARFTEPTSANVALDPSFGTGGQFVPAGLDGECAESLSVDTFGRIVVFVTRTNGAPPRILRYRQE